MVKIISDIHYKMEVGWTGAENTELIFTENTQLIFTENTELIFPIMSVTAMGQEGQVEEGVGEGGGGAHGGKECKCLGALELVLGE